MPALAWAAVRISRQDGVDTLHQYGDCPGLRSDYRLASIALRGVLDAATPSVGVVCLSYARGLGFCWLGPGVAAVAAELQTRGAMKAARGGAGFLHSMRRHPVSCWLCAKCGAGRHGPRSRPNGDGRRWTRNAIHENDQVKRFRRRRGHRSRRFLIGSPARWAAFFPPQKLSRGQRIEIIPADAGRG